LPPEMQRMRYCSHSPIPVALARSMCWSRSG
jgi:hypothetical protein